MTAITLKSAVLERLTNEEFYQFCMDNRGQRIERDANHRITIMPPTNSETGKSNNESSCQLANWNIDTELGGNVRFLRRILPEDRGHAFARCQLDSSG